MYGPFPYNTPCPPPTPPSGTAHKGVSHFGKRKEGATERGKDQRLPGVATRLSSTAASKQTILKLGKYVIMSSLR